MKPIKVMCAAAVLAVGVLCTLRPVVAENAPPKAKAETAKPAEGAPDPAAPAESAEVALARERVAKLSPHEKAIHLMLLRLVLPRFGVEAAVGDTAGPLRPLEDAVGGPLSDLELLRLWAVLATGASIRRELDGELRRLLDCPLPGGEPSLARCAAELLVIRAALRTGTGMRLGLEDRMRLLLPIAEKASNPTTEVSSYATPTSLRPEWFANHLWRAAITRAAVELKLTEKAKLWDRDLDLLCNACVPKAGFTASRDQPKDSSLDLHCNYFAWAALQLAVEAPEKLLSKAVTGEVARSLKFAPEVLARLDNDYGEAGFAMGNLALAAMLSRTLAPAKLEPAQWRQKLLANCERDATMALPVAASLDLAHDLGFAGLQAEIAPGEAVEAADHCLYVIGLCGGLWAAEPGPLAGKTMAEVGLTLYALEQTGAIKRKRRPTVGPDGIDTRDFDTAVSEAIDRGCLNLALVQAADGSFSLGAGQDYVGVSALCILALLHGGYERTSLPVARGMQYLAAQKFVTKSVSYECGIMLMMFQKYYEREAVAAGLLKARDAGAYQQARMNLWAKIPADHRGVIQKLVQSLNSAQVAGSGWGYGGHSCDNSNSQYAMLGYKAASLLGADVPNSVFSIEADRLISTFSTASGMERQLPAVRESELVDESGSPKSTSAKKDDGSVVKAMPGGWGYGCTGRGSVSETMAAAGVSSLMICLDEMKMRGGLSTQKELQIRGQVESGLAYIGVNSFARLADQVPGQKNAFRSRFSGDYRTYSIERACVMAGARLLCGQYDWYVAIAWSLVDGQRDDGSWGQPLSTSWAVLCLRRASMPMISEPKPVITPEPKKPVVTPDPTPKKPVETPEPAKPKKPVITEGPKAPVKDPAPKDEVK